MIRGALLAVLLATSLAGAFPYPRPRAAVADPDNPYIADVRTVLADAKRLDPLTASRTRYLALNYDLPANDDGKALDARRTLIDLWVNALSRRRQLARTRRVGLHYLAVDIGAYGWDPATWENLADEDPYYHVQLLVKSGSSGTKRFFRSDSVGNKPGMAELKSPEKDVTVPLFAPWLPAADMLELAVRTNSAAPIVRADWWFSRASQQEGRKGTGYYDWLQLKDQKDFDALLEFDRKKSDGLDLATAAVVARSGVSRFPRQVYTERALTGDRFETRDVITDNKDARNALRNLDDDYKHEVVELYGALPNHLFVTFLADNKGVRQDSAPDGVGFNHGVTGNDGKIHAGVACYSCHEEGLRPVVDWARQVYRGSLQLASPDPIKADRLQRLYLSDDFGPRLDEANAIYARALLQLTGLKPPDAAKLVGTSWAAYVDGNVLPVDAAKEFGMQEAKYLETLRGYFTANPLSDPVLASHIADPPQPIRRDDWEQLQPIVAPVILIPNGAPMARPPTVPAPAKEDEPKPRAKKSDKPPLKVVGGDG
jgi:hypothetical protein